MSDPQRNLNPHAEARVAMMIWSHEYAYEQKGGSMDFWDSRTPGQKKQCVLAVDQILSARRANGSLPAPEPLHGMASDVEWLTHLHGKMRHIAPIHGVDGFDLDCIADLVRRLKVSSNG